MFTEVHKKHIKKLTSFQVSIDDIGMKFNSSYVMYFWEKPLMDLHAKYLIQNQKAKNVLEIGFGLGVFAKSIYDLGIDSYTVVEPHPEVVNYAKQWQQSLVNPDKIKIIQAPWQLAIDKLQNYQIIMYDTWPPDGYSNIDFNNFINSVCRIKLDKGGRFSFFSSGSSIDNFRYNILEKEKYKIDLYNYKLFDPPPYWNKETCDFIIPIAQK